MSKENDDWDKIQNLVNPEADNDSIAASASEGKALSIEMIVPRGTPLVLRGGLSIYLLRQSLIEETDPNECMSSRIQENIDTLMRSTRGFRHLEISPGHWRLTKTVLVPQSVRIIGLGPPDGKPVFVADGGDFRTVSDDEYWSLREESDVERDEDADKAPNQQVH